jgi:hypothetical protein
VRRRRIGSEAAQPAFSVSLLVHRERAGPLDETPGFTRMRHSAVKVGSKRVNQPESRYDLTLDRPETLVVAIDHGQFIVSDRDSQIDVDAYGPAAEAIGLAAWSMGVTVLCESNWSNGTTVLMRLADTEPSVALGAFDHVAIAGFGCPSGELRVYAPEETGFAERQVFVPPGDYGLIVCGDRFGNCDQYGDDGDDRYALTLWPCVELPSPRSLKNGRSNA